MPEYKIADKPTLDSVKTLVENINSSLSCMGGHTAEGQIANKQTFLTDGTFVVPDGVTTIYVTACGGGGAGASGSTKNGGDGGNTIVGSLITLNGGKGAVSYSAGLPGGAGGGPGANASSSPTGGGATGAAGGPSLGGGAGGDGTAYFGNAYDGLYAGGGSALSGGGGVLGKGASKYAPGDYGASPNGRGAGHPNKCGTPPSGYIGGAGGGFGAGGAGVKLGGGGGGAAAIFMKAYAVTPGTSIPITIGAGGKSVLGLDNVCGGGGGAGICIIEW